MIYLYVVCRDVSRETFSLSFMINLLLDYICGLFLKSNIVFKQGARSLCFDYVVDN